jgi:hypothetical protein
LSAKVSRAPRHLHDEDERESSEAAPEAPQKELF